jgi:phage gp36-like protein
MKENEAFDSYLRSLDSKSFRRVTREIRRQCDNSTRYVLYNWRKGRSRIRNSYKIKINSIAGQKVFADAEIV